MMLGSLSFSIARSSVTKAKLAMAAPIVLAISGCAQTFDAKVSRFQAQLPAPVGQSFAVVADDPALSGGLEFSQYARLVEAQMGKLGYTQAANPESANLLVRFDYGVDKGRERIRSTGYSMRYDPFYSPWYGYGRAGYWGGYGRGYFHNSMWGYGWQDPFFDNDYESYTVYTSDINMKIDRRADGVRLFEGKAEAASISNRLPYLVPNLVEAMFTGFPGNSGETVRISVAPEKKTARRD